MKKSLSFGSLLLLSTALITPAAIAQTAPEEVAPASAPDNQQTDAAADQDVEISGPGASSGNADIIVRGRYIPDPVRSTPAVVSVLSAADIARTGEGDIAGALQRVTGLSVVGGKFVYVRGLGERYSLALLNGSPLPSPEPMRRVVPLDIFPTSVLASSVVQKSYSAAYPGEFGGGVINLTTRALPEESFIQIGAGISGDSITTFELGYTYYGSDTDWTGFDDGTRSIRGDFGRAFRSGNQIIEGANFTRDEIKAIGASLVNASTTLIQRNRDIPANFSGDIAFGGSFDAGDVRLGVIGVAGINNGWRTRQGKQQLGVTKDFDFLSTENRIVVNGMLNFGAEFGDHKIRFNNLFIRDTLKEARAATGLDLDATTAQLQTGTTAWYERQLLDTQLVGEFEFGELSVDLRGTYANSKRKAPYERSYSYSFNEEVDDYVNDLRAPGNDALVSFSDLNDDVYSGAVDLSYELPTALEMALSTGYYYYFNERDAIRRDFQYQPAGSLPLGVQQQRIDYLLSDFNLYTYDILLTEVSGGLGSAAYNADLKVHAGYAQFDGEVLPLLRATVGVRYEKGAQSVTPLPLFGGAALAPTMINNDYWLPAATITWNPIDDMQFRVSASKTIARPQFRELAPQPYRDPDSGRLFYGNQFLQDSELINAEARWEWYFDRDQRLSLAGFYKKIDNPIESVAVQAASTLFTTYANAPEAVLYGGEIELQKYFNLDSITASPFLASRRIVAIANYTYSDSEIKVDENDLTVGAFSGGVPSAACGTFYVAGCPEVPGLAPIGKLRLTGQSKHLVNLQFGFEDTERLSQQTLLLTYASPRVTNRGPNGTADFIEKPGLRLDFVAREGIMIGKKELEIKLEVRNITGEGYSETQDIGTGVVQINSYDIGTSVSLGASLKF